MKGVVLMDKLRELTIVGAGNGGKALAGDLANKDGMLIFLRFPNLSAG